MPVAKTSSTLTFPPNQAEVSLYFAYDFMATHNRRKQTRIAFLIAAKVGLPRLRHLSGGAVLIPEIESCFQLSMGWPCAKTFLMPATKRSANQLLSANDLESIPVGKRDGLRNGARRKAIS